MTRLALLACCLLIPAVAIADDSKKTVDLVGLMQSWDTLGKANESFASDVTLLTGGSLTIRLRGLGEVESSVEEIFDQVDAGEQKMFAAPAEAFRIRGKAQPFGILLVSGIPFGFGADEFLGWYYESGGAELVQEIFDRKSEHGNVLVLPLAVTSSEPPGFFMNPVPGDPEAFNASGITYRINYLGNKAMKLAFPDLNIVTTPLGVIPVDALCTGKIQGLELGTLSLYDEIFFDQFRHERGQNIVECGFKHLYLSSWQQPMLSSWVAIDRSFFDALAPHEQHAIISAAKANIVRSLAIDIAGGGEAIRRAAEAGAVIHGSLPPAILDRLRKATARVIEQEIAADPDFARIVESMMSFARASQATLLYDDVPADERFNRFPGWAPDVPIRRD